MITILYYKFAHTHASLRYNITLCMTTPRAHFINAFIVRINDIRALTLTGTQRKRRILFGNVVSAFTRKYAHFYFPKGTAYLELAKEKKESALLSIYIH